MSSEVLEIKDVEGDKKSVCTMPAPSPRHEVHMKNIIEQIFCWLCSADQINQHMEVEFFGLRISLCGVCWGPGDALVWSCGEGGGEKPY